MSIKTKLLVKPISLWTSPRFDTKVTVPETRERDVEYDHTDPQERFPHPRNDLPDLDGPNCPFLLCVMNVACVRWAVWVF